MHRKKDEMILRILAQESLVLKLALKRYGILKIQGYFVGFSEARDIFGIIFQILGPSCKIMECELIFKNGRGLIANQLRFRIFPDLFCCRNSVD
jgi:hypothetical protein